MTVPRRTDASPGKEGLPHFSFGEVLGENIGDLRLSRDVADLDALSMEGLDQPVDGNTMRPGNMS